MAPEPTYEELARRVKELEHKVSELTRTEDALLASEVRLRAAIDSIPFDIFVLDREGCYTMQNIFCRERWGNFIDKRPEEVAEDEETLALWRENNRRAFAGETIKAEVHFPIKGEERYFYNIIAPVFLGRQVISILGINIDITELKQTEEALRTSEARLQKAQQMARIGNWSLEVKSKNLWWSDELYRLFTLDPEDGPVTLGRFLDRVHPDDLAELKEQIHSGHPYRSDYRIVLPDDSIRFIHEEVEIEHTGKNSARRYTGTAQDITERKLAENALIEGEKKYRKLVDALNEGIWEIDKDSNTTFVNSRMAQMLGYTPEEMIGKHLFTFLDEQGKAFCEKNLVRRKQGISEQHEFELLRKDGSRIITLMEGSPLCDTEGNFTGGIAGVIDITARKQAEEQIIKNEEYIRNILDTVDDGFIMVDRDYRIMTANKAYCDQVSLSIDQVEGKFCYKVWQHTQRPCFAEGEECAVKKTFATGESHIAVHKRVKKDGETVFMETKSFPSRDAAGKVVAAIETTRNITEKYLLEAEQLKTQKLEAIGTLAGGIAHDFNNLLQGVFGYVSLAKLAVHEPAEVSRLLDQVENALALSVNLTNQLLTFAKGGKPVVKTTDLRPIVENASNLSLSGSRCSYRLTMPADLAYVEADEGQLTQVIQNIILNACEAMPEGGNIDISAANIEFPKESSVLFPDGGKYIKVKISDTGIGIPKRHMSKIFDPYFTTKHKGSGLGLATSYSIVRNHGGLIEVMPEPEIGTSFQIYLPAIEVKKEFPVAAPEERITRKCRILVMDDEDRVIDIAQKMIKSLGHDGEYAKDGEGALAQYRQALAAGKPFDIVILDLTIRGGMGGEETMKKLLEIDPNVKAVVSSGYPDNPVLAGFKDYGFSAVLGKPYTLAELRECLNTLVD